MAHMTLSEAKIKPMAFMGISWVQSVLKISEVIICRMLFFHTFIGRH